MLETTSDREIMVAPVASAIVLQRGRETLRIEPWGRNSVRVRVALGPIDDDGILAGDQQARHSNRFGHGKTVVNWRS